ncbi:MAG: Maf family protein [Vicinamibacterales bacterium]
MDLPVFVLASASPRRAELLRAAGFTFEVIPGTADETVLAGESAEPYVRRVAEAKAAIVLPRAVGRPVLSADTVVVVDQQILGKPANDAEARRMLTLVSGRTHQVVTGVCLAHRRIDTAVAVTHVEFAKLSPQEIDWYVASGEPDDKAGAYAIQGIAARFVRRIEGSYSNVVGLPVALVHEMLLRA